MGSASCLSLFGRNTLLPILQTLAILAKIADFPSNPVYNRLMKISDLRRDYGGQPLYKKDLKEDPVDQFDAWFQLALESEWPDVNALALATARANGLPSVRVVLLKDFGDSGFSFFTNFESRKARELEKNPEAALVAYWSNFSRQVRIEGGVRRLSRKVAEEYFHSRPRGSQLSAYISPQSAIIQKREEMEQMYEEARISLEGKAVPVPENWGGYTLRPVRFEFWQGRQDRLHDRFQYVLKNDKSWRIDRLAP